MEKKIVFFMIMILTVSICHTSNLTADDGHWAETNIFPTTFNWGDSDNWVNGVIAGGAGATAYFTNGIVEPHDGNPKGILMGSNPTLENLYATLDNAQPPASSVIIALGTITLEGSPVVTVVGASNFHGFYIGAAGAGYGGVLAGTDGFTKEGNGKLYLQGDNTISGTLNHKNGNIWLDWPTAAQSLDVIVNPNAILTAAYGTNNIKSITVNNNLTIEGNGHHGGAIEIWNTVAYGTYNGTNTLAGNTRVFQHGAGGEMIFNGPFTGTNAASLEMIGQGADPAHTKTFYLNAQNTHNGPTTLSTFACGTFYEIGINDCFPSDQPLNFYIYHWSKDVGMSVNMFEYTQNIPSLNLFCGENLDSIELLGDPGSKLSVEENVNQSGGIAKINTCELEIGGVITINGTMLGMSNITFLSGSSVSGEGTVDALMVPFGVAVAPGNSIGTLNIISNLTMETGSIINWEVGNPGSADLININGSFTVPAGGMTINAIDAGLPEGTYTIVQTSDGIIGDASNITMNYSLGLEGDAKPTINGNNLEITVTPEPATIGLIAIFGLVFFRKEQIGNV